MILENSVIAILGLGYVGLPLAIEFGKKRRVIGFDIDNTRVHEIGLGIDSTNEITAEELRSSVHFEVTSEVSRIKEASVYIVTVPTPINVNNRPDLQPLLDATEIVGSLLDKNDVVIYESTVYPGATEEACVPILERVSGLEFNRDFYCGYSPERINPGDKIHRLPDIVKVTSGSNSYVADAIDRLYREIIVAGTYQASSIKVAEAAKVIENTQRDLNIALMNELSIIFRKLGVDSDEVLKAASTKWNFSMFRPGLVGGHCIGVDPYYLTYKSEQIGYRPEIILAGRRLNDSMSTYVASQVIQAMTAKKINIAEAKVLILGLAFKEDCPDLRNSKVINLHDDLASYNCAIEVFDPLISSKVAKNQHGITVCNFETLADETYDCIVVAVPHQQFIDIGFNRIRRLGKSNCVIADLKNCFPENVPDFKL